MSIHALFDLQERLHHAAIAGVHLIHEDFRLRKAIEQFEKISSANPVFTKIYQQVQPMIEPTCTDKAAALLDAVSLVDAVVCTQATAQVEGEHAALAVMGLNKNTQIRYSELMPLHKALTEKGSGRYEVVEKARHRKDILNDCRLYKDLIGALGDSYSEMCDLVALILKDSGETIIPIIKAGFDPQGKREMARRVQVIAGIAGPKENDFYVSLLEDASKEVRLQAIHSLRLTEENTEKLIHIAETGKGDFRKMALESLGRFKNEQAEKYMIQCIAKDKDILSSYLLHNDSPAIADALAEKMSALIDDALATPDKKLTNKQCDRLKEAMAALYRKLSPKVYTLFDKIATHGKMLDKLCQINDKGEAVPLLFYYNYRSHYTFMEAVNQNMVLALHSSTDLAFAKYCMELYEKHGDMFLQIGLFVQFFLEPEKSFEKFSGKYSENKNNRIQMNQILSNVTYNSEEKTYYLVERRYYQNENFHYNINIGKTFDVLWIKALIKFNEKDKKEEYNVSSVLSELINREDPITLDVIKEYYRNKIEHSPQILDIKHLITCGEKNLRGIIPRVIRKKRYISPNQLYKYYKASDMTKEEVLAELVAYAKFMEKYFTNNQWSSHAADLKTLMELVTLNYDTMASIPGEEEEAQI